MGCCRWLRVNSISKDDRRLVIKLTFRRDPDVYANMAELWFLFSLIWSVGATLDDMSRKKMDTMLRELNGQFPSKVLFHSIY